MIVDFSHVPPHQIKIHERLENWARWAKGSRGQNVHPMFRQYRNDYWEASAPPAYSDTLDAVAVQKIMKDIPEKNRIALQWFYIARSNPIRMCRELGVNKDGLADLVIKGRTMADNLLTARKDPVINLTT